MSRSSSSAVKGWLVGLRSVQILALLVSAAFTAIALTAFAATLDYVQHSSQDYISNFTPVAAAGVGVTSFALAVNLAAVALCITWLVYTLSPARRAKASCCGNHASCITFRHDVGCDIAFAVLYGLSLISSAVQRASISSVITSAVMMALFIATAALSSKMGQAARQEQEAAVTGFAAPAAAAHVQMAAPSKAVQMV